MSGNNSFKDEYQIEVKAGQTLILEIIARPKKFEPGEPSGVSPANLKVRICEFESDQPAKIDNLKLFNSKNTYIIPIKDGIGELIGIEPGTYSITLIQANNDGTD